MDARGRERGLLRQRSAGDPEQARDDVLFARARAALGDDAGFDRAWDGGRAMPLALAVAYALRSD
jgi:hypothetical protein